MLLVAHQIQCIVLSCGGGNCGWRKPRDICLVQVATDMQKPDGQYAIPGEHSAISRFVDPLPIRKVPGIGKVRDSAACSTHLFLTQPL